MTPFNLAKYFLKDSNLLKKTKEIKSKEDVCYSCFSLNQNDWFRNSLNFTKYYNQLSGKLFADTLRLQFQPSTFLFQHNESINEFLINNLLNKIIDLEGKTINAINDCKNGFQYCNWIINPEIKEKLIEKYEFKNLLKTINDLDFDNFTNIHIDSIKNLIREFLLLEENNTTNFLINYANFDSKNIKEKLILKMYFLKENELFDLFNSINKLHKIYLKNLTDLLKSINNFIICLQEISESNRRQIVSYSESDDQNLFSHSSIGILQYYETLKMMKKNDDEYFYNDFNLPKITIIRFVGNDELISESLLKDIKTIQYINIGFGKKKWDFDSKQKNSFNLNIYFDLNELFPMEENVKLNSNEIWFLFEKVIFKLTQNFKPFIIVMEQSFGFYENNPQNIFANLTPKIFNKIINRLSIISENRFILVPVLEQFEKEYKDENLNLIFEKYVNKSSIFLLNEKEIKMSRFYYSELLSNFFTYEKIEEKEKTECLSIDKKIRDNFYLNISNLIRNLVKNNNKLDYLNDAFMQNPNHYLKWIKNNIINECKNYKNDSIDNKDKKKNIEKLDENTYDTKYLTNKITLIKRENNEYITKISNLIDENRNDFFYDAKKTTYYICYDKMKIFMFHIKIKNEYKNYYFEFNNNDINYLQAKEFNYHLENNKMKISDFSITYCKESSEIYLIWGLLKNLKNEKNKIHEINDKIYCYNIENKNWSTIRLISKNTIIPRLYVSSTIFMNYSNKTIFLFGGSYSTSSGITSEICNIVEKIEIDSNKGIGKYECIPKSNYKNGFIPLFDSLLINLENNNDIYDMIMLGGKHSEFIINQKNIDLIMYRIRYNNKDKTCNFEFIKTQNEEKNSIDYINLFFSTKSKNFILADNMNLITCSNLVSNTNKIILDYNNNEKNIVENKKKKYINKFEKKNKSNFQLLTQIDSKKKDNVPYAILKKIINEYFVLNTKLIDEVKNIINKFKDYVIFFKKNCSKIYNTTINENNLHNEGLYTNNDMKKIKIFNNDRKNSSYCKSEIKMKEESTVFSKKNGKIYYLEDKFNQQRNLYEIDLNLLKSKLETKLIFSEENNYSKNSSLCLIDEKLYLLGGDNIKNKNSNIMYDFSDNSKKFLKSNICKMKNPIILTHKNYFIVLNKAVINDNFEMPKIFSEKTKFLNNFSFIYGEIISIDNLNRGNEWQSFLIDLLDFNVIFDYFKQPNIDIMKAKTGVKIKYYGKIKYSIKTDDNNYNFLVKKKLIDLNEDLEQEKSQIVSFDMDKLISYSLCNDFEDSRMIDKKFGNEICLDILIKETFWEKNIFSLKIANEIDDNNKINKDGLIILKNGDLFDIKKKIKDYFLNNCSENACSTK